MKGSRLTAIKRHDTRDRRREARELLRQYEPILQLAQDLQQNSNLGSRSYRSVWHGGVVVVSGAA
jgi:hypothetical protein